MTAEFHTHSAHAAERAAERYGIEATPGQWLQAWMDISDTLTGVRCAAILTGKLRNAER